MAELSNNNNNSSPNVLDISNNNFVDSLYSFENRSPSNLNNDLDLTSSSFNHSLNSIQAELDEIEEALDSNENILNKEEDFKDSNDPIFEKIESKNLNKENYNSNLSPTIKFDIEKDLDKNHKSSSDCKKKSNSNKSTQMAAGLYDITSEKLGKGHFAVVKLAKHCLTDITAIEFSKNKNFLASEILKETSSDSNEIEFSVDGSWKIINNQNKTPKPCSQRRKFEEGINHLKPTTFIKKRCPQLQPSIDEKLKKAQVISKCLESTPVPENITRETIELHRELVAACALKEEGWFTNALTKKSNKDIALGDGKCLFRIKSYLKNFYSINDLNYIDSDDSDENDDKLSKNKDCYENKKNKVMKSCNEYLNLNKSEHNDHKGYVYKLFSNHNSI
ncbi:hypothetical protein RND71_043398 [Anisodus tanguticus]|uniref:Uncharacterized protein n=1 Tax=Anisodus tanguticus TaxID=243964 RepID=A0AAE1UTR5_9SOLA|nr:hypothetical protein RND71_043398 [Anisodus tanguticus]